MIEGMAAAFSGFFSAFQFILRNGLGWLFLVPALLWVILSIGLFALLSGPVNDLALWISDLIQIDTPAMEEGLWRSIVQLLQGAGNLMIVIVLKIAIAWLLFTLNKYIVLILLSPVLAYASERAEEIITGRRHPFRVMHLLKDALRGSVIAMRNGILELLLSAVVWMLTLLLPFTVPLSVALLFLISAWFYGFSTFDYIFERRRMRVGESVQAINERIHLVVVNGALFSLLMKIPLVGMTFAPVMAAVGAVLAMKDDPLLGPDEVRATAPRE
jgi:CysZ protein